MRCEIVLGGMFGLYYLIYNCSCVRHKTVGTYKILLISVTMMYTTEFFSVRISSRQSNIDVYLNKKQIYKLKNRTGERQTNI